MSGDCHLGGSHQQNDNWSDEASRGEVTGSTLADTALKAVYPGLDNSIQVRVSSEWTAVGTGPQSGGGGGVQWVGHSGWGSRGVCSLCHNKANWNE